ncbi:lysophospholipid acyltransferase family protein [Sphingomonas rubra]|uniref:1-acyl-sn-glycerol-3-phosphate acyltransferase n=1 Tax=Sphingomonas rubra TaxID=634430 RepID=A0A1I5SP18_9SPHN|nr:lysophospholipid acyltransferase family protein [Sphingomonas rubra]SFP72500.1 1-acyl-sn-glycerol-3-phosphate acyltransferase [Sphingomonas rubra]
MASLHLVLRLLALASALILALPIHGLWRLLRLPSPWPRRFLGLCARIVGARVRVVGTPLTRDAVILANHLSWIDILLLADSANAVFVAKGELASAPLVGWLAGLNDTIFVARGDRMAIGDQVAQVRAALGPRPVAIFPEGTTGDGVTLLPFKPALLAALVPPPAGVRVQAVRIDYGDATRDLAWVGDENGAAHALRVLRRRGRFTATLRFAEPFAPSGDRKAIAAEARRRIEAPSP